MTEEDKALLRQYEGAGGLGENGASAHGTLYEYYTPRNVVNKVWQIVDKYLPGGNKSVLEPSAGIGRFAEDRSLDSFTLNEYDPTSARISKILHPEAENTQGAFQAMFRPGKPYTGKKFDVVIGNPPYGEYEGLWKGKGEGKGHDRYEEYFIDRGLDTLREGGIMAFVVPSTFLRGKNDKIKEKIAAKGKLLEAWRLPNGTFNTTGVGTDIIIVRKEKGDPAAFSGNAYFEKNPQMVIGTETTRTGRFGKEEEYVALEPGVSFDEAIDSINAGYVEATPVGVPTEKEKLAEKTEVEIKKRKGKSKAGAGPGIEKKIEEQKQTIENTKKIYKDMKPGTHIKGTTAELIKLQEKELNRLQEQLGGGVSEAEEHRNRSEAMMGNENAAGKRGGTDTAAEFNAKYNKNIAPEAIPIWKATNLDGSINVDKLENSDYLEKSGNYVKTADGKWYDVVNFASGDIYTKLDQLESDKGYLSDAEYKRQKALLEKVLPKPQAITEFEVSPLSYFAENFITSEVDNGDDWRYNYARRRSASIAGAIDHTGETLNLNRAFVQWLRHASRDELALQPQVKASDVIAYVNKESVRADSGKTDAQKKANKLEAEALKTKRREDAERLFNQFIRERLSLEDQERLVDAYNRQYNGSVQADFTKIPLFLDGISKTFKGNEFKLNDSQIKALSWYVANGNGIAALDVGVGKTIVGICAAVIDLQMGRCKKPFFPVPKAVYENWKKEIAELFPNIKVNDLGNFGDIGKFKGEDGKLKIEEGSLSICTYEALEKVGFTDETMEGELKDVFMEALDAMTDEEKADAMKGKKKAQRKGAKQEESIMTKVGQASKTGDNWINWEDTGFDHVTVDECLPYNTPILTDRGWVKIGDIVENRVACKVLSCNLTNNTVEWKQITDWMPKPLNHKIVKINLENGESLVCTHNHKIWTVEEGYVVSEEIAGKTVLRLRGDISSATGNDQILQQDMCGQAQADKAGKKDLRSLRERIFFQIAGGIGKLKTAFLFGSLHNGLPKCTAGNEGGCKSEGSCDGGCNKREKNALSFNQNERKQSDEKSRCSQEDEGKADREGIQKQGRERAIDGTSTNADGQTQPSGRISYKDNGDNGRKCPKMLQGRFSHIWEKNRHRIGRKKPQDPKTAIGGLETGQVFDRIRVESVEVLERGCYERYGFRSANDTTVYDITVEDNHNFVASGILVKNCHNFRNSFSKPRSKKKGDSAEFDDIPGGSTSLRGLKLFAISQMVQKNNNGRNVHLLSATPFQNSPVEIYNMLSLVAREDLQKAGIMNFNEFLVQFAELKPELSVDSKNNMVQKNVMKGFKNLPALQNLLNRYIMKIDGEDAGIIRPDHKDHQVYLNMTAEQRDITEKIRAYMEAGPKPEDDPGATLRCINALRQAALSPMLVNGFEFLDPVARAKAGIKEGSIRVTKKDFVKDSPKMKFVSDTTAQFYKQHPDIGQIIHLPQGVEHYETVKKYLVSQGVPEDAIVFMAPKPKDKGCHAPPYLRSGDAGNDQKELYKEMFNDPKNKVKIIIGSDTIKEGVNLNGNTAQTYPCMLDWNPTGTQQLRGRSWRQGNEQGMVHFTFPLMNDSIDSFMYQKHDEKQSRLDTLWKSKEKKMEIDEVSPEELKFMLIKDPKKRADLFIKEKTAELLQQKNIAEATSDKVFTMAKERKTLADEIADNQSEIAKRKKAIDDFNKMSDEEIIEEHGLNFEERWSRTIYDSYGQGSGKDIKEARKSYIESVKENIANDQKAIARCKGKMETIDNTLKRYEIDSPDNAAAIERVRKRFANEALRYKAEIEEVESNRDQYIKDAAKQIKAEARPGLTIDQAVETNLKEVGGNLYSMKVVKDREKAKQDAVLQKALNGKRLIIRIKKHKQRKA